MDYCFAFRSTDARLLWPAMEPFQDVLTLEDGAPHGWGMGYYQSGQPLLKKHPKVPPGPLDVRQRAQKLRSRLLIGHRRARPVGIQSTNNTHPFRFRNWIFCHCGRVEHFEKVKDELLSAVPDFIRRNIRGASDSEHLFHLFLAFVNDTGKLDDPRIGGEEVGRSLVSTMKYLDRMTGAASPYCCMLTNGNILVAVHRGLPLKVARHSSYRAVDRTADDKPISYPHLKSVILIGGKGETPEGWETIDDDAVVIVDGDLNIEFCTPSDTSAL